MTNTELLAALWRGNQLTVLGPISKLTADNYRNRLTPETASAGFIALHAAEAMHNFAKMLFGRPVSIELQAVGGVSDDGRNLDLNHIIQTATDAFAMVSEHIDQMTDEQWTEVIPTPFGEVPRRQILAFLMHHNSYHAGQIAQAVKKGKAL